MNSLLISLTSSRLFFRLWNALLGSILLSAFIYLYHYDIKNTWIFSFLGFLAIVYYLKCDRSLRFFLGFFTGILWFYWIPFSFRFFGLDYFIPLAIVGIGCFYGVLFYVALYLQNIFYRAAFLFCFPFIAPFGFNWFDFRIMFAPSVFDISYVGYGLILLSALALLYFKGAYRLLSVLVLIVSLFLFPKQDDIDLPHFSIELVSTDVPQQMRWDQDYVSMIVFSNFNAIDTAIVKNTDLIVFPETAFPFILHEHNETFQKLLDYSEQISIVVGSLRKEGQDVYNTSYLFHEGTVQYVDKQILVPFGEYMPLPAFLKKELNAFLKKGEFSKPSRFEPIDFRIDDVLFRSAICYEATDSRIFEGNPDYMIAISNNAWFTPSIEPTLQELIMLTRARESRTVIYHAINGSLSRIIRPHR